MKSKHLLTASLLAFLLIPLTGCDFFLGKQTSISAGSGYNRSWNHTSGGGGGGGETPDVPTGITLAFDSEHKDGFLSVGTSLKIIPTVVPNSALNKNVWYETSNSSIATVNTNGVVTGVSAGDVTITVYSHYDETIKKSINVRVTAGATGEVVSYDKYVDESIKSKYRLNYQVTNPEDATHIGLSDPSNVGIDPNQSINCYYPVPKDDEFDPNCILTVTSNGSNDWASFNSAIQQAKTLSLTAEKVKIKLPSQLVIDFSKTSSYSPSIPTVFLVDNLINTYIDGGTGCLITVKNVAANNYTGFFSFKDCNNVHLNAVKCTLEVPDFVCGTIAAYNYTSRSVSAVIDPIYNKVVEQKLSAGKKPLLKSFVDLDTSGDMVAKGNNFASDSGVGEYAITGNSTTGYVITAVLDPTTGIYREPSVNNRAIFTFTMYDGTGNYLLDCSNMYFEDVTYTNVSGMVINTSNCVNQYFNRVQMIPEYENCYVSAIADGFHIAGSRGELSITNSTITYNWDDAVNVKNGFYYKVDSVDTSSNKIAVSEIVDPVTGSSGSMPVPQVGERISIYGETDFANYNPSAGYFTIKKVDNQGGVYVLTLNENILSYKGGEWVSKGTICTFKSIVPDHFTFANNYIGHKRRHALLCQVPNATIENNTFEAVAFGSLSIASDYTHFREATVPSDIIIRNNKFVHNDYTYSNADLRGDIYVGAHNFNTDAFGPKGVIKNVVIENNFMSQNGNACLALHSTKNLDVKNNLFADVCWMSQYDENYFKSVVYLENCGDVTVQENYHDFNDKIKGIVVNGSMGEEDVFLDDTNVNLDFASGGSGAKEYDVNKTLSPITVDGNLSDWASSGAHEVVMQGMSGKDGDKYDPNELSSFFKVNRILMTHDDDAIYVAFDVFDDQIEWSEQEQFFYNYDFFEIISTNSLSDVTKDMDIGDYKNNEGVEALQLTMTGGFKDTGNKLAIVDKRTSNSVYAAAKAQVTGAINVTGTGYTGEVRIPYTCVPGYKASIDKGEGICFAITVGDAERSSRSLPNIWQGNVPHYVDKQKLMTHRTPRYIFK